ncbi:serine/arginine repetitive matrix protein 1 [Hordeum vulgare subsp. vulgare]|uniref:Predicted protein n=2 Tax=Hordeum vulgare subsp. vulgare TaxID=112509 RepID=F2CQ18_HORVV|nr:serine/arginine repetitive matrix protein 1 [Hordeum vulgare subsp. vulgare]KAI4972013.1 hypothetical protein ZWY2020_002938 [Hordeum vulgare]BAJ84939.1 predicted protein [Hordeum vulgare subsp. vulgare]
MRPRGRGDDPDDDEDYESSPQRSASGPDADPEEPAPPPPQPPRAPLSSLVVRPSPPPPQDNGASSPSPARSSPSLVGDAQGRRRGSSLPRRRREFSSPDPRIRERRRSPPPPARRRPGSPPPPQRRRFSPPGYQPRPPRFYDEPQGYDMHAGPSPPRQRRLESSNFDDAIGPRYTHGCEGNGRGYARGGRGYEGGGRGYERGGRGGARFRDGSPPYGRGGRSHGRGGYNGPGKEFILIDGEYVHRNDPNLSPREGDWICQNPSCGNLNFARRSHCNNCNKHRYESSRSPHRGYFDSPPRVPARPLGPPSDRAPPREMARYKPAPRGWGVGDPRSYPARSPPDRVGRFPEPLQRERGFRGERELRDPVKFEWSAAEYKQRERPHGGLYLDRSRSPQGNWGSNMRDRSRSPAGNRPMKGAFLGRGRPDLEYAGSYAGRGRLDAGRGRGRGRGHVYRPGGDPYPGEGRDDRRAALHGRDDGRY